jgi:hypothetical protein
MIHKVFFIILILIILLLINLYFNNNLQSNNLQSNNLQSNNLQSNNLQSNNLQSNNDIKILLRQTSRWAVASEQDKSPMIAVLHANYAVGYLQALTDIATEKEINKYIDFNKFKKKIYDIQDNAVKKVVKVCPNYIGNINKELALIGINIFNNNENTSI